MFRKYKVEKDKERSRSSSQASGKEKHEEEASEKEKKPEIPQEEYVPKDSMISYSHQDKAMMNKLRGKI